VKPATPALGALAVLIAASSPACTERRAVPQRVLLDDPSEAWGELLEEASSAEGVDYDLIDARRGILDDYMAWIGAHGPRLDSYKESKEDEAISFLVNAYNASVVYGVLQASDDAGARIDSVRDLRFGVWQAPGSGFFGGQRFFIDGEWVSLHHLEQEMIVNRYQEPLLHAALNCASAGCPELRWFSSKRLQVQLQRAMRAFLASDRGLRPVGAEPDEGYTASEIFSWYGDDFLDWSDDATVCEWMQTYAKGKRRTWLKAHADDCPLSFHPYDWSLNQAAAPAPEPAPGDDGDPGPPGDAAPR